MQTNNMVPAVPIVVKGAIRASYWSMVNYTSVEIVALTPVYLLPVVKRDKVLVVYMGFW